MFELYNLEACGISQFHPFQWYIEIKLCKGLRHWQDFSQRITVLKSINYSRIVLKIRKIILNDLKKIQTCHWSQISITDNERVYLFHILLKNLI